MTMLDIIEKPIVGDKVSLRKFGKPDLKEYIELILDSSQREELDFLKPKSTNEIINKYKKTGFWGKGEGKMLIIEKEMNKLVGELSFFKTSPNIYGYELGYRIFKRIDRSKGYMTEALKLFSSLLFDWSPRILTLLLNIVTENTPSIRVAEKCGYDLIGTMGNARKYNNRFYNYAVYMLHKENSPPISKLITNE